jgi:hypothetical protein
MLSTYKTLIHVRQINFFERLLPHRPSLPSNSSRDPHFTLSDFDSQCQHLIESYSNHNQQILVFSLSTLSHHCFYPLPESFHKILVEREIPHFLIQILTETTTSDTFTASQLFPLHKETLHFIVLLFRQSPFFPAFFLQSELLSFLFNSIRTFAFPLQQLSLEIFVLSLSDSLSHSFFDSFF